MVGKTNPKTKAAPKKTATKTKTAARPKTVAKAKPATEQISTGRKITVMVSCIVFPIIIGILSSALTGEAMSKFGDFNKPPLAPPAWLFPVAWTLLYAMMGLAFYFIIIKPARTKQEKFDTKVAATIYFAQLAFNFVWSPLFFLAENYFFALMWLIAMWLMIIVLMFWARHRSMTAVWLLLPYALWCLFAMYLNASIMLLN